MGRGGYVSDLLCLFGFCEKPNIGATCPCLLVFSGWHHCLQEVGAGKTQYLSKIKHSKGVPIRPTRAKVRPARAKVRPANVRPHCFDNLKRNKAAPQRIPYLWYFNKKLLKKLDNINNMLLSLYQQNRTQWQP